MRSLRKILMMFLLGFALFTGFACEREGPAERAGETVDEAVEDTRERAEEATE
jgi:hypothetical protein